MANVTLMIYLTPNLAGVNWWLTEVKFLQRECVQILQEGGTGDGTGMGEGDRATGETLADGKNVQGVMERGIPEGDQAAGEALSAGNKSVQVFLKQATGQPVNFYCSTGATGEALVHIIIK